MRAVPQLALFALGLIMPSLRRRVCGSVVTRYEMTASPLCTQYDTEALAASNEGICALRCREKLNCVGFCHEIATGYCTLYSKKEEGTLLRWISFKKMGMSRRHEDAFVECSDAGLWMPLPTSQEEFDGMRTSAGQDFRVDLDDLNHWKTFTTFEEDKNPPRYFWMGGQPNYYTGHRCVLSDYSKGSLWNDLTCDYQVPVYCQTPKPLFCIAGEMTDPEVVAAYDPENAPCYKLKY